ncbi:GAG-binding domain-containing protein [Streptococcus ruminantium]|nr:GAG-binding domain-containing protein [Streptococcus ruminantium]
MTPQKKRHYSIRKLRAGVGSILIGTTLLFGLSTQLVQANVTTDGTTSDSAGGTAATPGVTATGTNAATTATGGETATTEEKPKVEEPKEKPVEETPKEAAPKAEDKKEAETPNTPTNPADHPMVKELEKLLEEVNKQSPLDETGPFKGQAEFWKGQKPIAEARLKSAKSKTDEKEIKNSLEDYVQYAKIEKMARHAQQLYKKHASSTEMLDLIKKAFEIGKDKDTYASLEGPNLVTYVNDDVIRPYNQILELAKKLDEEKAKKEKEKEQPAPAPEEPKKEEKPAPEKPEDKDKPEKTPDSQPQQPEDKDKPTPEKPEKQPEDTDKPEEAPKKPEDTEKPADPKEPEVPKKDETPAPTPDPKKDTEKPAPSQPKQDDSMKKDYKLFYQTKDKTEEVDFKGTPEELKATLDKAIEKYKQNGYPYVDRFERENRILLVFNQHKSIIVLETNGDGGSRQSRPFYGTPQELEAEIKKLTENLSDTYKIEKKEGYDKLDPTVKTITLVLTKLSDTPKETPAPKKEDKPTPPKDEKQTQPEDKKPEQPKKDEKQTQPEDKKPEQPKKDEKQTQPEDKKPEQPKKDEKQTQPEGKKAEKPKDEKQTQPEGKKAEKPKDEKQTQPEGKKPEQPKDKKPVPAPKKAEKAMPSKARTPKKVLPNTGEASSILAVLGSGLLGFLGIAHTKKRKK